MLTAIEHEGGSVNETTFHILGTMVSMNVYFFQSVISHHIQPTLKIFQFYLSCCYHHIPEVQGRIINMHQFFPWFCIYAVTYKTYMFLYQKD